MRIEEDDIDLHISYGKCFEKFPQNVHVYIIKLHNCENLSNASHFLIKKKTCKRKRENTSCLLSLKPI